MSATLLCFALFLGGTQPTSSYVSRHDPGFIASFENDTFALNGNGVSVITRNHRIIVEEVDKNGNSVLKELELPDYNESEELQEDKRRREQQMKNYQGKPHRNERREDMYGCHQERENQRRKCLQRQKKLLRNRYRNWKQLIRRIIKDLEGKIKHLGNYSRKGSRAENLHFLSGFSPGKVMRKKE